MIPRKFTELFLILLGINFRLGQGQSDKKALYYGFFFDEITAKSLKNITDSYFQLCYDNIPDFKTFLDTVSKNASVEDIHSYYSKPLDPNTNGFDPYYHVTAKYCGGDINCNQYEQLINEKQANGKIFDMELIGYYFTRRTFGIRVKLTAEQLELFDNNSRNVKRQAVGPVLNAPFLDLPQIEFITQEIDFQPTRIKPHVTIGTAPNISAVTTGTDLLEIIEFEADFEANSRNQWNISDEVTTPPTSSIVVEYGDNWNAFVIYPGMKVVAKATFQPYFQPQQSSASTSAIHMITTPFICILLISYL